VPLRQFTKPTCGAKLILPRDQTIWHPSACCQQSPLPGKQRCARHGGSNAGARTPEGMARAAMRLHQGRRKWIARMKAEGQPLPFAGFKPKGSGTPREARAEVRAARAREREVYAASALDTERAVELLHMVRALVPAYIRKDHWRKASTAERTRIATEIVGKLNTFPAEGPFAEKIATAKCEARMALAPAMVAKLYDNIEPERAAKRAAEATRQRERNLVLALEHSRRWQAAKAEGRAERAAAAEREAEVAMAATWKAMDCPRPRRAPAPVVKHAVSPDWAGRVYGRQCGIRRRDSLAGEAQFMFL